MCNNLYSGSDLDTSNTQPWLYMWWLTLYLQVHVVDVSESAKIRRDPEYASSTSVGTVDIWKNYLVIGFPNVQIIDLDTQERRELRISIIEHEVRKIRSYKFSLLYTSYSIARPVRLNILTMYLSLLKGRWYHVDLAPTASMFGQQLIFYGLPYQIMKAQLQVKVSSPLMMSRKYKGTKIS